MMEYASLRWNSMRYNGIIRERDVHQPHDKGYKSLLSSKKVFLDLLRSFVNRKWVEKLDEAGLVKIDKSYVSADYRGQESDLVYQASFSTGNTGSRKEILFYVLLELQSEVDQMMPYRLLTYMTELWRDVLKNAGSASSRRSFVLPAIVPIVIYNGKHPWTAPRRFKEKLAHAQEFGKEVLDFSYLLIDVQRYDREMLLREKNLISSVFLLDQARDVTAMVERLSVLITTLKRLSETEWNLFWSWTKYILGRRLSEAEREEVNRIVQLSNPGEADMMITNIEKAIVRMRKQERQEGKLEGKREGLLEGKRKIARKLLATGMTAQEVAQITELSAEEVAQLNTH